MTAVFAGERKYVYKMMYYVDLIMYMLNTFVVDLGTYTVVLEKLKATV